ncbi:MAG TPA: hypothetical protein DEV93_07630 [Chloroflexi bacterium]|nr:hypothetical protein [Chloroflexota bacterium]
MTTPRPKRQHFVPRSYLARFADDDVVLVRRRDSKIFTANPSKVAVECGFYDVADFTGGGKSSRVEEMLASIDDAAINALRTIDETDLPPPEGTDDRQVLSIFLALQNTRTPEQRARIMFPAKVAEYAGSRKLTKEVVYEFLERIHLGFPPSDNEAQAAFDFVSIALSDPRVLTAEFAIQAMFGSVKYVAPVIAAMNWTLEIDRKQQFVTSDLPFIFWRAPTIRDQFEGVGVNNAEELRFPLDPGKQLVITKRKRTATARISPERARACNADTASACYRFIVGRPSQQTLVKRPHMDQGRPVVRFNTGPLYAVHSDGTKKYDGDVLHMWVPRR